MGHSEMHMIQAGGGEFKKTKQRGRERSSSGCSKGHNWEAYFIIYI